MMDVVAKIILPKLKAENITVAFCYEHNINIRSAVSCSESLVKWSCLESLQSGKFLVLYLDIVKRLYSNTFSAIIWKNTIPKTEKRCR